MQYFLPKNYSLLILYLNTKAFHFKFLYLNTEFPFCILDFEFVFCILEIVPHGTLLYLYLNTEF